MKISNGEKRLPWYIHTIGRIYYAGVRCGLPDGSWPLAPAEPYTAGSLLAAWSVLTGKAYAIAWPKPGDLEEALGQASSRSRGDASISPYAVLQEAVNKVPDGSG